LHYFLNLANRFYQLGPDFGAFLCENANLPEVFKLLPDLDGVALISLASLMQTIIILTDADDLEPIFDGFQWEWLLGFFREGRRRDITTCCELAWHIFTDLPQMIQQDGAIDVVQFLLVSIEDGDYRQKETAILPLCHAVTLANEEVIKMMVANGLIENLVPFLSVSGGVISAVKALDFLASFGERFGIQEITQRMIDDGVVGLLEELTVSGHANVAEAAAAFLRARRCDSEPDVY
jgi:hypothetical protein